MELDKYKALSAYSAAYSAEIRSLGRYNLTCNWTALFKPLMNWNRTVSSSGLEAPSSITILRKISIYLDTEWVYLRDASLLLSLSTWSTSLNAFSNSITKSLNARVVGICGSLSTQVRHQVNARPDNNVTVNYYLST